MISLRGFVLLGVFGLFSVKQAKNASSSLSQCSLHKKRKRLHLFLFVHFNMTKYFPLLCAALLLWLSSCDAPATNPARLNTHQAFDLAGFLNQEANALAQQKVAVKKTVSEAGEAKETKTLQNLDWKEELGSFADADINKPALKGLFDIDKATNPAGDQLIQFTAKEGAKTPVRRLSYVLNSKGQLLQLNAMINQESFLFKTYKRLYLEANPSQTPQLQLYQLEETQKLLFMHPEEYGIVGEIARP